MVFWGGFSQKLTTAHALRRANFPNHRSPEGFDFTFNLNINRGVIPEWTAALPHRIPGAASVDRPGNSVCKVLVEDNSFRFSKSLCRKPKGQLSKNRKILWKGGE